MLPSWLSGKELTCQFRIYKFDPWVRKIPWRRKWKPTPVFLPGKSHGQRSKRVRHNQATKQQKTSNDSSNITMQTQYPPHLTSHKAALLVFHVLVHDTTIQPDHCAHPKDLNITPHFQFRKSFSSSFSKASC